MGHADADIASAYREKIGDDRLRGGGVCAQVAVWNRGSEVEYIQWDGRSSYRLGLPRVNRGVLRLTWGGRFPRKGRTHVR